MTLQLTPQDHREHASKWLLLLQGMLGLSEREKEVLTEVLVLYLELSPIILDQQLLWENILSTSSRQRVQQTLGLTRFALSNYLAKFRQAGIFQENGQLLSTLLPQSEFIVKFIL